MHSNFDALAAQLAAIDHVAADTAAAVAAYQQEKQEPMNEEEESKTNADIICAGVRACHLALEVLQRVPSDEEEGGNAYSRSMRYTAKKVLADWGIDREPRPLVPPETATPPASPPDTLMWPPPAPTSGNYILPDVYKENFYSRIDVLASVPYTTMVLLDSFWHQQDLVWRMRFRIMTTGTSQDTMWLTHTLVKPGDEIPKVDASTLAGNTDP
jgi:hypothetical protein